MIPEETIVIIPAYNEEKLIFKVVTSVKKEHPDIDIVVINDGSEDDTAKLAAQAGAVVLSHPFNMGYGSAIQTGYKYALRHDYRYLVQIDGDGQHDTRDIGTLLEYLVNGPYEVILGSRFLADNRYRSSVFRYAGTIFFRCLLRIFLRERVTDPTSGFQAMNQRVLRIFAADSFPCDYPDADVIILLSRSGIKMKEVPVRMNVNSEGKSMHGNPLKVIYYLFKMVLSMTLTTLRKY
ncbi:MAG: glycosyltransferase family 2 protein [Thermodesulfobacteriota bacterium]|nr:glycosyltransferase family 2 protein [Thermodesulfobacteriota bacterium]